MSTHVIGFRPPDDEYQKMVEVYYACDNAGVEVPKQVLQFFEHDVPPPIEGVKVSLEKTDCVKKWKEDSSEGFEVDVAKLPNDIRIIRFYNSW